MCTIGLAHFTDGETSRVRSGSLQFDSLTNSVSLFYGTICLALGEAAKLVLKLKGCGHVGSVSHGACASLRTSAPSLELTPLLASGFHTCVVAYT